MKEVLQRPAVYQLFQVAVGAFSARARAIHRYLEPRAGQRMIDIGCGPGHILNELPEGVIYRGFDVDETYIDFANERFGTKGKFHCRLFDEEAAAEFGPVDLVMMNGVLHHMDDHSAGVTLSAIEKVLRPGGFFFALDGVYVDGQSAIAKWFLDKDRGRFVRTEDGYRSLLSKNFAAREFHLHHDLLRIPYSLIISKCQKAS
jgi:SAM-dependent methyltransferase